MEVKCLHCSHELSLPLTIAFEYYVCPVCFSNHKHKNGALTIHEKQLERRFESDIAVGKSVVLDNEIYWVTNAILKRSPDAEYWKEYELVSETGKYKYLTEEYGNWTISEPIELDKDFERTEVHYNDMDFVIFENGTCEDNVGVGFFDFKIGYNTASYRDFICPPYLLSSEKEEGERTVYFGKHISPKEVKELFGIEHMPYKSKIGMVQPFVYDFRKTLIVFCYAAIIALISHMIFYKTASNTLVYSKEIDLATDNGKEFTTDVFELKGPIAPLNIYIDTDVDNSWVATDFSLINQTTNETAYFSKDMEYYHGYEGGENWSEGSTVDEFNVCGVSSGKYRISFRPNKETTDVQNSRMKIEVYWNRSDNWNFMSVLIAFVILTGILYYIRNNFEQRRWYESDYSPYNKAED